MRAVSLRPSADQWPQTILGSSRGGRASNQGTKPAGALSLLTWKSIRPSGEQKRIRVIALTITRRRPQPSSASSQCAGLLP